jgi:hypothetical protein
MGNGQEDNTFVATQDSPFIHCTEDDTCVRQDILNNFPENHVLSDEGTA